MSWSVNRIGKPEVIKPLVISDIANYHCAEPEETVKNKVGEAIVTILDSAPTSGYIVRIEASGSQYASDSSKHPGKFHNSVNLKIETIAIHE